MYYFAGFTNCHQWRYFSEAPAILSLLELLSLKFWLRICGKVLILGLEMETKYAKVLDSGRRVVVDLKRKRSTKTILTGAASTVLSHRAALNSSICKLA